MCSNSEKKVAYVPSVRYLVLPQVELSKVAHAFETGLKQNFANVSVQLAQSPDLRAAPFHLAAEGICGNVAAADVGGERNLIPVPQKEKIYNTREVAKVVGTSPAFVIGPGAGPFHENGGVNCELIVNSYFASPDSQSSSDRLENYIVSVDKQNGAAVQKKLTGSSDFALMGNLLISEGKPGQVIKVEASARTGPENFITVLRLALKEAFQETPVSVGGCFLVQSGKAKLHVMTDFPDYPLSSMEIIDKWLNYYDVPAPLVFTSLFHSSDAGLELRMEHSHGFSVDGAGGHYHYDVTPEEISYVGYFTVAERLFRIN